MLYDRIGTKIKLLRQQNGMTQDQLSDILCVSHQMISKYESGATLPDIAMLIRICGLFGVTLDVLCGLDEDSREQLVRELYEKYSGALSDLDSAKERYALFSAESEGLSGDDRVLTLSLKMLENIKSLSPQELRAEVNEQIYECASRVLDLSKNDELRSYANYLLALYYWEKPTDSENYDKYLALSREYASKILLCTYFPDYRMPIGRDVRSEKLITDLQSQNLNFFAKMLSDTLSELSKRGITPVSSDDYTGLESILGFAKPTRHSENINQNESEIRTMKLEPITLPDENYDWTKTLRPEQPYLHDYSKTLTYKLFLANPNDSWDASVVRLTFEDALGVIKRIDALTPGLPKSVYLVGWQYYGHDSKYPAWDEVNEALKRQNGESALDSLRWLMNEGYKYNTTISLHINIKDAYDDSPLWETYLKNELIARSANGELRRGGVWNNKQAYIVSYCREWETGYLRARIDRLCEMLPIVKAGTIHIDAMQASDDPGHGYSLEDCQRTRNQIVRYFRKLGIDVTTEFIYYETPDWREKKEQLIGLCPLVYHFSQNLDEYMKRPADLVTGVYCSRRMKEGNSDLMYKLFGQSIGIERIILREEPEKRFPRIFEGMCLELFRMLWLNSLKRLRAVVTADNITAYFSDGVETDLSGETRKNGVLLGWDGNLLCPAGFMGENTFTLYSRDGGVLSFDMTTAFGFAKDQTFRIFEYTDKGISDSFRLQNAVDGILKLELLPCQGLVIRI